MKAKIKLKEGCISYADISYIDRTVNTDSFPWYFNELSTTKDFPFFSHSLVGRFTPERIDSEMYPFFKKILYDFCLDNDIKINEILRGCLNLTYPSSVYEHGDPHVDYTFDTNQVIMYLNEFDEGETLVFNEEYGKNGFNDAIISVSEIKRFTLKEKIIPQKGKIIFIDGKNYHTTKWCSPKQRRIICVWVFK